MIELDPCPHCGGKADFTLKDDRWHQVICGACGCRSNEFPGGAEESRPKAAASWNRRAAQQDGAVSLSAEEAYILFLIVDTEARWLKGKNEATNALREKLLPAYREWHLAHPFEVHPHTTQVCEQMQQLRRDEQGVAES